MRCHDPLLSLIKILAQVAVEEFFDETNNLQLTEEGAYDKKPPHRDMNPARPTKGADLHVDYSTPTRRREKFPSHH